MWRKIYGVTIIVFLTLLQSASRTNAQQTSTSPFGINAHLSLRYGDQPNSRQTAVDLISEANIGWIREEFNWELIQPSPLNEDSIRWQSEEGQDSFNYEESVDLAYEAGLTVVGLLAYGPNTNVNSPFSQPYDKRCDAPIPNDYATIEEWLPYWQEFVQIVVEQFGDRIDYWEIGNEINSLCFWRRVDVGAQEVSPTDYLKILQASSEVIRRLNPDDKIILGGLAAIDPYTPEVGLDYFDYLYQLNEAGGWPYFDILAIHPYRDPSHPERILERTGFNPETYTTMKQGPFLEYNLADEIQAFKVLMQPWGEKPIWITEIGWSTHNLTDRANARGTEPMVVQSDYLIRATIMAVASGAENVMWYDLRDDISDDENQASFGIVQREPNFSRKYAYFAYKNMATLLADSTFVEQLRGQDDRDLETDDDVYEYHFRNGSQTIIAIWKARGGGAALDVSVNNIAAQTVAIYGPNFGGAVEPTNEVTVTDNSITLSLTERPLFLVFSGDILGDSDNGNDNDSDEDNGSSWSEDLPSLGDWWDGITENVQSWWEEQQDNLDQWWQKQQEAIVLWMEEQLAQVIQDVVDAFNRALSGLCTVTVLPLGGALAVVWNGRKSKSNR